MFFFAQAISKFIDKHPTLKVLALDYGSARTGVAVSDPTGTVARPLEQRHVAARFRQVIADMHLEAMAFRRRLAVIADRNGEEMILNIGLFQPGCRA